MSNKANPKKFAQLCRRLSVLSDLLIDTVEDLEKHGPVEEEFKASLKTVKAKCEETLQAAYSVDKVQQSTYIGDLSKKIDTIIRKNFEIKNLSNTDAYGGLGREADEPGFYDRDIF